MEKVPMSYFFSFSRYQTKILKLLSSYFTIDDVINFKHPLKQWPTGRKRREDGNAKF